jgi:zinc transporter 1/2/3
VFHQFFEGIALSTVVLDSNFSRRCNTVVMIVVYTLTTPSGIALGIGLHQSFNSNSTANLIIQGALDAISAGILLYDSLVNIIGPHFKSEKFNNGSGFSQFLQILFLWIGAAVMAYIGRYA